MPRTVRYIHTIVHRMFKDAVRWGRLVRNPADAADPPRVATAGSPEIVTWTAEQLGAFLHGNDSPAAAPGRLVLLPLARSRAYRPFSTPASTAVTFSAPR